MQLDSLFTYDSVALNAAGDGVVIVDQTLLPGEERFLTLRDEHEVYEAIAKLRVRGAPAIGIAAAYGLYVASRRAAAEPGFDIANARDEFYRISRYLCSARGGWSGASTPWPPGLLFRSCWRPCAVRRRR